MTVWLAPTVEHAGEVRRVFCGEEGLPAASDGGPLLQRGRETHFTSNGVSATAPATALKISPPPNATDLRARRPSAEELGWGGFGSGLGYLVLQRLRLRRCTRSPIQDADVLADLKLVLGGVVMLQNTTK